MFKTIKRVITGYKVKHFVSDGLKVKVQYRGKLHTTDPLSVMRQVIQRLDYPQSVIETDLSLTDCWEDRMNYLKIGSVSFIATFGLEQTTFRISRYVSKQGKSPLSLYTLMKDDKVFAFFSRVYDYGAFFKEMEGKLVGNVSDDTNGAYLVKNGQYQLLIDSFGHSQSFFWNNDRALDQFLQTLK